MLLQYDGSEFGGMTYVRNLLPHYSRPYPEVTIRADNQRAFSEVGDRQLYIDSFTLECWGEVAVRQVKAAIADEASHGLFVLEVPDTESTAIDRYLIRFFEASFSRLYPRRSGFVPVFSAEIEDIEVLGQQQG